MIDIVDIAVNITLFVQEIGDQAYPIMFLLSFLGSEGIYIFLALIIYWNVNPKLGLHIGILSMISAGINTALKIAIHSPRPYWVNNQVKAYQVESSFGIPSGHAQNAVVFWGTFAFFFKKGWFWLLSFVIILIIGLSRIYLGVHFFYDVILGWFVGLIILIAYFYTMKYLKEWIRKRTNLQLLIVAFSISLFLIGINILSRYLLKNWQFPQEWLHNIIKSNPEHRLDSITTLKWVFVNSGTLFGFTSGAIILRTRGGFNACGSFGKKFLRVLVGITAIGIFFYSYTQLFPIHESPISYISSYCLFTMIGAWISWIAPITFYKLGLATPNKK